ncbi:MAG: 50S ribosomal protein L11 methyltransferase, partial [Armatimonadetes bacterium]|nr:50S ribosomal protein L11 methyltransferase [Armatimonadota bacterium]
LGLCLPSTEIRIKWLSEEDWTSAYRAFLKPTQVGRIIVTPSWEPYWEDEAIADPIEAETQVKSSRQPNIVVQIDPGMAFGTGHHETTRLCLVALQDLVKGGEMVLDVGTGSGILAIAAVKLGAARAVGIEIDTIAARIAAENAEKNGVSDSVTIIVGDSPRAFGGQAEIILANILPDVIVEMAADLRASLKYGGKLVTSGIVRDRANDVTAALESLGMPTIERREEGDWVALISEKPA